MPEPPFNDLRPHFFAGADWYESLAPPEDEQPSAWYLAKEPPEYWGPKALSAGLAFALEHGLESVYRARFAGIRPADLLPSRARAEGRSVCFPMEEIANELIVARYLERSCNWRFLRHEPPGRGTHVGEWEFDAPGCGRTFVEVKSIAEVPLPPRVGSMPFFGPRLRKVMARAYRQLPRDRPTLVVLVGDYTLHAPAQNPMLGDLFGALFGQYEISFRVLPYVPDSVRAGPSFHDMFVQRGKHRAMGAVAAMRMGGIDVPGFGFYVLHNPWAEPQVRLDPQAFGNARQFVVDGEGRGTFVGDRDPLAAWPVLQP